MTADQLVGDGLDGISVEKVSRIGLECETKNASNRKSPEL